MIECILQLNDNLNDTVHSLIRTLQRPVSGNGYVFQPNLLIKQHNTAARLFRRWNRGKSGLGTRYKYPNKHSHSNYRFLKTDHWLVRYCSQPTNAETKKNRLGNLSRHPPSWSSGLRIFPFQGSGRGQIHREGASILSSVVEQLSSKRKVAGSIPAGGLLSHGPGH